MTPLTSQIYWASKSPVIHNMVATINELRSNPEADLGAIARAVAEQLMNAGRISQADLVDVPIMLWNWDPVLTMQYRIGFGYAWTPSALAPPVEIAPGIVMPGQPSYNPLIVPPLSIKVSMDAADYPAYSAPSAKAA
jgi:hypothetical protein